MQQRMARLLAIGAATAAMACTNQPPVTTTSSPATSGTSSGDVVLSSANNGMWMDSVGGTWMDSSGGYWRGGRNGMGIGFQAADVRSLSNENIVAHLAAGDSLEVALSQTGADRAQNQAVRDFARRMVAEHSAHMQMGKQTAVQGGITPAPSPADTIDAMMATRMMSRLSNASVGSNYDRQLMQAEVMMHQHMLHELQVVQPQASGAARQLVDQTIPVVQQHLTDARALWQQVGGGTMDRRGGQRGNRNQNNGTTGTTGTNGTTGTGTTGTGTTGTPPSNR